MIAGAPPNDGSPRRLVLGLPGSLRRDSFNRRLLAAAATVAPAADLRLVLYDGLRDLPLFDEDIERATAGGPEPVRRLRQAVSAADAVLIATPEYNWSVPGVLKNAIDWLSRPAPEEVLAGKPVAVMGASSGRWGTRLSQTHLRQVLAATESVVMPSPTLFIGHAERVFDADGRLVDPSAHDALVGLLRRLSTWIEHTLPAPPINV